jgi:hypothetical protein
MDAETGEIVAAELTTKDAVDAAQVGPLLGQVAERVVSFTGDGAYDQDGVAPNAGPQRSRSRRLLQRTALRCCRNRVRRR